MLICEAANWSQVFQGAVCSLMIIYGALHLGKKKCACLVLIKFCGVANWSQVFYGFSDLLLFEPKKNVLRAYL